MKKYKINEVFNSIQGEGSLSGVYATFIRFSGCNIGYKECKFCDTDWVGGTYYTCDEIMDKINGAEWIWLTGGEPLLQVGDWDDELSRALYSKYRNNIAIETNGTKSFSLGWRPHVVMSPKVSMDDIVLKSCNDLKVIYPYRNPLEYLEIDATNRFIQPIWKDKDSLNKCIDFVRENKSWRLSLQTHKMIGEL